MLNRGADWLFRVHVDSELEALPPKPPEKRLLVAILIRAAHDALSHTASIPPLTQREARQYFGLFSDFPNLNHGLNSFSFSQVCDYLDLCPFTVHKNLKGIMVAGGIKPGKGLGASLHMLGSMYD
jgi:hypothetical protein